MSAALTIPSEATAQQAHTALEALRGLPRKRGARNVVVKSAKGRSAEVTVPPEAFDLFLEVLGQLASGNAVTIVPVHAELTTQQAADMLGVSRPYLIRLLEDGKLPFSKVGSHRRLKAADVMAYKEERDAEQREVLRELSEEAQKLKLGY